MARDAPCDAPRHFPKGGFLPTAKGGLMGEGESEERGGSQGGFNEGESEERGGQKPMYKSKFLCTGGWVHAALALSVDGTPSLVPF